MKTFKNLFQRYYGKDRAAKSIYGAILIYVFVASMHISPNDSYFLAALGIFAAGITIVFAEVYAEIIGMTIKQKGPLTKNQAHEILDDSLAIASVSLVPTIFFILCAIGLFSLNVAFLLSYGYCLSVLLAFSYWASRLSGYSQKRSVIASVITLSIGLVIIGLKFNFGH